MTLKGFFDKTIAYSFYLLFFLVPLTFSPVSFELFEYPKMMLVYGLTVVIVSALLGKMVLQKRIYIQRTPLDFPLLLYLGSCVLSTIFSIDRYTSLWGYYSRSHGGLFSTISYILLYYAFVSNTAKNNNSKFKNKKENFTHCSLLITHHSIYILLFSSFLVAGYGILERLGIDKDYWVQDVQNRVFSTLGQPNWLGAFLVSIIFIPLALIKKLGARRYFLDAKYLMLFTVYFLCLIFTNSKSAILAFWACFILFIGLIRIILAKHDPLWKRKILPLLLLTILIYFLLGQKTYSYIKKAPNWVKIFTNKIIVNPSSNKNTKPNYKPSISESSEIRKVVWQGAINIWEHYPVLGSGVETFGYAYYNFRPKEHNLLSEWDFLYNKAHNEFLNILACQGTIGIITYLFLIGSFLWWAFKKIKQWSAENPEQNQKNGTMEQYNNVIIALVAGYASILITNFFGFSVVVTGLLFFMIPAFCFANAKNASTIQCGAEAKKEEKQLFTWKFYSRLQAPAYRLGQFLLLILLCVLCSAFYILINRWRADYYFAKGEKFYKTSYLLPALTNLEKAVQLNTKEALYHAYLAKTSAKLVLVYLPEDDASDAAEASESAKISSQLADLAEKEINRALTLNSVHLNFYKNKAEVYIFLSYLDPSFKQKAIDTLLSAVNLAPTDAKILYNLGLLYEESEETEKAIRTLEKAIALKPNYLKVYLELADLYQKNKEGEKAKIALEFVLQNIDPQNQQALEMLNQL